MGDELDAVFAALEAVDDEVTFIAFVHTLAMDRAAETAEDADVLPGPWGPGSRGWENATIETFLESAAAWASDSRLGLASDAVPDNPWRRCADILFAGKHYE